MAKTGRPKIGHTVKTSIGPTWFALVNRIVELMPTFTRESRRQNPRAFTIAAAEDRAWDRSSVLAQLVVAGAPQFAHHVLGQRDAVKRAQPCPICWGYVDGPHAAGCGYFGPLAELDSDFRDRLRALNDKHAERRPASTTV